MCVSPNLAVSSFQRSLLWGDTPADVTLPTETTEGAMFFCGNFPEVDRCIVFSNTPQKKQHQHSNSKVIRSSKKCALKETGIGMATMLGKSSKNILPNGGAKWWWNPWDRIRKKPPTQQIPAHHPPLPMGCPEIPAFSPKLQITPFVTMLSYVDLWWSAVSPSPWEDTRWAPNTRLINGVKWCLFLMAENKWVFCGMK